MIYPKKSKMQLFFFFINQNEPCKNTNYNKVKACLNLKKKKHTHIHDIFYVNIFSSSHLLQDQIKFIFFYFSI